MVGTPLASITNNSAAPSLRSEIRRGSQRSGHSNKKEENFSTYKLDENCSVVDNSMKWEGFSGFYKPRAPFIAERTVSKDRTSPGVKNRSPRRLLSNDVRPSTPPTTPVTPSSACNQDLLNFRKSNQQR